MGWDSGAFPTALQTVVVMVTFIPHVFEAGYSQAVRKAAPKTFHGFGGMIMHSVI